MIFARESRFAEKLAEKDATLWDKIKQLVMDAIKKLQAVIRGIPQDGISEHLVGHLEELAESFDEMMADALYQAGYGTAEELDFFAGAMEKGAKKENPQTDGDVQFQNRYIKDYAEYDTPPTVHDIRKIHAITAKRGQVSINNLTQQELHVVQKWAHRYWENPKIRTKSPFFRAWFGEWRAYDINPVEITDIPVKEIKKQQKTVVCQDTGWEIRITGHGRRNTRAHAGQLFLSVKGLNNIYGLIENAIWLDTEIHQHHDNNAPNETVALDHKLYSLGKDQHGRIALYKITIEETFQSKTEPNDLRFHNLRYVKEIEKVVEDLSGSSAHKGRPYTAEKASSTTTYSISDLYGFVKQFDKDFSPAPEVDKALLNEDGTPKELYHQTAEEFEEFDPHHKGAGTNDDETPFGIFMKPTAEDIGLKGKKQMALYARILSPLMVSDRADLANQLKKMSPTYKQLIDQRKALSGEYQQKIEDAAKKWAQYAKEYRIAHPDATRSEIYEDAEFNKLYEAEDILTEEWIEKADQLAEKCKEEITKTLRENGYDGVIIKKDDGSFGRSVETYIALDPTQVKSATDNIGTFDGNEGDIQFQYRQVNADTDRQVLAKAW